MVPVVMADCLLLNVVQSVEDSSPRALPEAFGSVKTPALVTPKVPGVPESEKSVLERTARLPRPRLVLAELELVRSERLLAAFSGV